MAITDNRTPNFSFPLTDAGNALGDDQARINEALTIIDTRFQEIVNQTQSPDAGTLGGQDLAFILSLANATSILPLTKGGTGGSDAASARAALGFDGAWDAKFAAALSVAPEQLNTIQEIVAEIQDNDSAIAAINTVLASKADQTALNATDARVTTAEAELDVVLPDGAAGTFTYPRYTTAQRDALDMTGKAKGYTIHNTTTEQNEAWDGVSAWVAAGSSLYQSGDEKSFVGLNVPTGWTFLGTMSRGSDVAQKLALPSALTNEYVHAFASGKVAVFSGSSADTDAGYLVDPVAGTSVIIPERPSGVRKRGASRIELDNGKLLFVGGADTPFTMFYNHCELYDPATNTWATAANYPSTIVRPVLAKLPNGDVIACGGNATTTSLPGSHSNIINHIKTVYKYDESEDSWSASLGNLTHRTGRSTAYDYVQSAAIALDNNTIVVAGGTFTDAQAWVYDYQKVTLAPFAVTTHGNPNSASHAHSSFKGLVGGVERVGLSFSGGEFHLWNAVSEDFDAIAIQSGYSSTLQNTQGITPEAAVWVETGGLLRRYVAYSLGKKD